MITSPVDVEKSLRWWSKPRTWVVVAMMAFMIYFGLMNIFRHANLMSAQYDLGNMDQVLWNSLHGRWFVMTDALSAMHQVRTAVHADFLLLAYLPFYALWPDPRLTVVLQVVFVGLGVLPLYWFGKKYLSDKAAALISIGFLFYPMMQWALVFDVHAVVLAIPLFLWAIWAASEKRWWIYAVAIALVLLAKEEIGVTVGLLGLFLCWWRKPRWVGLVTVLAGFGWTALMLWYAIPAARHFPGHFALGYYSDFGGSTGGVVTGILFHPLQVAHKVFGLDGLHYQFDLLFPLGGISLLGLPLLVVATPELLVNLLSSNPNLRSFYFQYASVIIPFVFASAVLGLRTLQTWLQRKPRLHQTAIALVITANLVGVYRWGLLPGTQNHDNAIRPFITNEYAHDVQTIAASIPVSHKVATTNNIAPHFTQRDYEWAFPGHLDQADDVVVLTGGTFEIKSPDDITQAVVDLQKNPDWKLVRQNKDLYYFQRVRR